MLPYLSMKEDNLFFFFHYDISQNHSVLGYVMELIIENFSMSRGATTWFKMFGAIVWNLLIIEPFFHRIF